MTNSEKANIILQEIEYYLQFDTLQREYAEKGILKALSKIERDEYLAKELPDDTKEILQKYTDELLTKLEVNDLL